MCLPHLTSKRSWSGSNKLWKKYNRQNFTLALYVAAVLGLVPRKWAAPTAVSSIALKMGSHGKLHPLFQQENLCLSPVFSFYWGNRWLSDQPWGTDAMRKTWHSVSGFASERSKLLKKLELVQELAGSGLPSPRGEGWEPAPLSAHAERRAAALARADKRRWAPRWPLLKPGPVVAPRVSGGSAPSLLTPAGRQRLAAGPGPGPGWGQVAARSSVCPGEKPEAAGACSAPAREGGSREREKPSG